MGKSARRSIYIIICIMWCCTAGQCESKPQSGAISGGPAVGTILESNGMEFMGEYENYHGVLKYDNHNYEIFVPKSTYLAGAYHFSIIKEVPRPDSITVNETNKYYHYYEVLLAGHTCQDIRFCDTDAISYIDIDDINTYLITIILSPTLITDTLLCINSTNWLTSGFNYKLSLVDSMIAIGRIVALFPKVEIIKIGENNGQTTLYTITNALSVNTSYDYRQFLIEQMAIDGSLGPNLKSEIMIYDIPSDQWITLSSDDYAYSKPIRISRDDYLYYMRSCEGSTSLWRTMDGISEELIYDPGTDENVHNYSLSIGKFLVIDILKDGEKPDFKNLRQKCIDVSKLYP